ATSSFGGINLIDTVGYAFAIDNGRSEYLYNSFHVDYDVGNQHRVFPLMELNWFYYTKSGGERPIPTEGLDLANIGGIDVSGQTFGRSRELSDKVDASYRKSRANLSGCLIAGMIEVRYPVLALSASGFRTPRSNLAARPPVGLFPQDKHHDSQSVADNHPRRP